LKSDEQYQKVLSEAVTIIGKYDFPSKWENLFDQLIGYFGTGDFHIINGVLRTIHSITKRYRYETKCDDLWREIKFVLEKFAIPFTELFVKIFDYSKEQADNPKAIKVIVSSLVQCAKIFYSLNSQDLPEEFEDRMKLWMPRLQELLVFENKHIESDATDDEPTEIEHLKSSVIDSVNLYATRYDEEFSPFLESFVMKIWQLLMSAKQIPRFDSLVASGINFLTAISQRPQYKPIFGANDTVDQIFQNIVVPNSRLRETDVELFEDNPEEFIRADLEGSDADTRRRAAQDLIKGLTKFFEEKLTQLAGGQIEQLMGVYATNPGENWAAKESALFLVTALITKAQTRKSGVTQVSTLVNVQDFFDNNVLPEIVSNKTHPVLQSSCIKFTVHFRNQIGKDRLQKLMVNLCEATANSAVVLKSYAAHAVERCLVMKGANFTLADIGADLVTKLVNQLCTGIAQAENQYMMRALLRVLTMIYKDSNTIKIPDTAVQTLRGALERAAKNPAKPDYNHYMFECVGATARINLKNNSLQVFQTEFFPLFMSILENEIVDFMPYVFQILGCLLEGMPEGALTASPVLQSMFPALMQASLWDGGSIPPLARLVGAYIQRKDANKMITEKIQAILGLFQKLINSKANDQHGIYILNSMVVSLESAVLTPYMPQVIKLIFSRIQKKKTNKVVRGLLMLLSTMILHYGPSSAINLINSIQPNMFPMVLEKLLLPELANTASAGDPRERRGISFALAIFLTQESSFLDQENHQVLWPKAMLALCDLFQSHRQKDEDIDNVDDMPDDIGVEGQGMDEHTKLTLTKSYQASFSALSFTGQPKFDILPAKYLKQGLKPTLSAGLKRLGQARIEQMCMQLGNSNPGDTQKLQGFIQQSAV